jgi:hypothetical protein
MMPRNESGMRRYSASLLLLDNENDRCIREKVILPFSNYMLYFSEDGKMRDITK